VPDQALRGAGRLLSALLLAVLVAPAVIACGSSGDSGSSCTIADKPETEEITISGPHADGCGAATHKEVSAWQFLGFGMSWQYGAPAPSSAPVCTVTGDDQTWKFYGVNGEGGDATIDCRFLKTKEGLHVWQIAAQQAG
jgi:hypothetical protein